VVLNTLIHHRTILRLLRLLLLRLWLLRLRLMPLLRLRLLRLWVDVASAELVVRAASVSRGFQEKMIISNI
jgi:hypothetical protein